MPFEQLSPPKRLAIAYSTGDLKAYLGVMLCLDDRLSGIYLRMTEPMIAQMRIAWWNDVMAKPAAARPKGEPLVSQISELEARLSNVDIIAKIKLLITAWDTLISQEILSDDILDTFAQYRAGGVFAGYAQAAGLEAELLQKSEKAGKIWAITDFANMVGNTVSSPFHPEQMRHSCLRERALKPLSILNLSAVLEHQKKPMAGIRLSWHGLTGR